MIVTGGEEGTLRVWEVEGEAKSVKLLREFGYHFREITSVDVSPDGRYVCSASMDNTLRIFGLDSGKLVRTLTFSVALGSGNLAFKGCRFDPSGSGDLFSM